MLRPELADALKSAMRAKEQRRVSTVRLIQAAIKDRDIAARGEGKEAVSDEEILQILQKMVRQRRDSIEAYEQGGRLELAEQEREEIAIIETFLPKQMDEDEIKAAVAEAVIEAGAESLKDMGKVIGLLKARYAGQMDFGKASAEAKTLLSA